MPTAPTEPVATEVDRKHRVEIRRLAGSTTIYLMALVLPRVVRLVAVPLIVHAVAPDVYGAFATLWALVGFGYATCDLGLGSAAVRLAPEAKTASDRRSLFATMLLARAGAALAVAAFFVLASRPLASLATGDPEHGPVLALLFVSLPLAATIDGYTNELRAREAHAAVGLLTVARTLISNLLTLLLVVGLGMGLYGLTWARPVTDVALFAIGTFLCWRFVKGRFDRRALGELWSFGWPIGMLTLLAALRGLDRPVLRVLSSVDQVAAYDLAMRLVGPIALPTLALGLVLQPVLYRHADSPDTPRYVDLFVRAYLGVFGGVALAVAAFSPEFVRLLSPASYHGAIRAVPALVFFQVVDGLMRVAGVGAELVKRTRAWALATTASVAVGLLLLPLLVPRLEVSGAAFALLAGTATGTLVAYYLSLRVSGLRMPVLRGVSISIGGAILGTAAVWFPVPLALRALALVPLVILAWHLAGARLSSLRALFAARN